MIDTLKPYSEIKDSKSPGLDWIPSHWNVKKLRGLLRVVASRNRPDLPLLSVVREKGIILRDVTSKDENHNFIPDDLTNYKVVRSGQFAMNKMKAWQGSYGVSDYDGIVSPAYYVFDLLDLDDQFFSRAIRSKAYIPFFTSASDGVRVGQWDLSKARMRKIPFLIPPRDEQAAIVKYLDYMDRRIKKLIVAKKKLIKLLEEQKQAIIHQAVTKGLDPNVSMKDSGVEWPGEVPAHWSVMKLKRLGEVRIGLIYSPSEVSDQSGVLVLRASNVKNGEIVNADNVYVSKRIPNALFVIEDDILICVRSGSRSLVGKSAIIPPSFAGVTYGAFMSLLRSSINQFLIWVFHSNMFPRIMAQFETSTINQLTQSDLNNLDIPVPSELERSNIIDFLQRSTQEIDTTIAKLKHEISLLSEYYTRLVSDIVTGKLDVREAAANLPNEDTDGGNSP